jgi:D-lactate dehydrogenase (cytochrome)
VIRVGRPVVKNVAGYDLPKIFVGSRGTLGLIVDVTLKIMPLPRARRTLTIACDDPGHLGGLARGLDYAAKVLPLALVASAIVLVKNENGFLFAYTAEGLAEDVEAELEEVQRALQSAGATMNEVEMPTGTDLWSGLLRNATESELVVRVAVAPKDLADFARSNEALFAAGKFLVDVANGFIYAVMRLDLVARSREWVELLRRAAQNREGYAVVMRAPNAAGDHIDWWGHRPELYDLMQKIKARWDPAGILDS